jgi:hypothetical protein
VDFGWTTLQALATLGGYVYAGGSGIGGTYLWYEQQAANWVQTINLEACTAVQDLLSISDSSGLDQLFAATAGVAGVSRFYRVEIAPASAYVCGVDPPHFVMKIIKG